MIPRKLTVSYFLLKISTKNFVCEPQYNEKNVYFHPGINCVIAFKYILIWHINRILEMDYTGLPMHCDINKVSVQCIVLYNALCVMDMEQQHTEFHVKNCDWL